MRKWMCIVIALWACELTAQDYCIHGCPTAKKNQQIITNHLFTYCNNAETKFADWVAYRLDTALTHGAGRNRYWRADPNLPENETLEPDDYTGAYDSLGIDRGHLVPLGAVDGSEYYYESNYLSNITPQKSALNRGLWKELEQLELSLVEEHDTIWGMAGTFYDQTMPVLPNCDEPHQVPSGYWKVIWYGDEVVAYFFDQNEVRTALSQCMVSLKKLNRKVKVKLN